MEEERGRFMGEGREEVEAGRDEEQMHCRSAASPCQGRDGHQHAAQGQVQGVKCRQEGDGVGSIASNATVVMDN